MVLLLFLIKAVAISLSGVMAPGPMTAAAIAMGARNRFAGALIAVGHGIIEFPLMILITLGMGTILESAASKIIIGLVGGMFLVIIAVQMLRSMKHVEKQGAEARKSRPILAGIALSGGNPFFFVWWASAGLNLAVTATSLGIWAFALFAIIHWLCDLVWFSILSFASFKGSVLLGPRRQRMVVLICSVVLLGFGVFFIYKAVCILIKLI